MQFLRAEDFYTNLEDVFDLLKQRVSLREIVEERWIEAGLAIPHTVQDSTGLAFIARCVPTFRYEDAVFVRMAETAGLKPMWLGYTADKVVGFSSSKSSLLSPIFSEHIGRKGGMDLKRKLLVDIREGEGRPFSSLVCNGNGITVAEFHKQHLLALYPTAMTYDFSQINLSLGGRPIQYYPYLLSLAVAHGVLFENFHCGESGGNLTGFTHSVFEPAFQAIVKRFGVKPLIVPLPWWVDLGYFPSAQLNEKISWRYHKAALKEFVALD